MLTPMTLLLLLIAVAGALVGGAILRRWLRDRRAPQPIAEQTVTPAGLSTLESMAMYSSPGSDASKLLPPDHRW
jgi:hypothetical protein